MEQADVEPDWRIERAVLVDAEPSQLFVEDFPVILAEIAVRHAPVGDRARHTMNELLDRCFAFERVLLAVEILGNNHLGREQ